MSRQAVKLRWTSVEGRGEHSLGIAGQRDSCRIIAWHAVRRRVLLIFIRKSRRNRAFFTPRQTGQRKRRRHMLYELTPRDWLERCSHGIFGRNPMLERSILLQFFDAGPLVRFAHR